MRVQHISFVITMLLSLTLPDLSLPLSAKYNSVTYDRVREVQVGGIVSITKVVTSTNLVDMLTKFLTGPKLIE